MGRRSPLYTLTAGAMGILLTSWNLAWLTPALWLDESGIRGVLAHGTYRGFRLFCHQQPDRTFHWKGQPLGVCQRCSGIYAGLETGWLVGLLAPWPRRRLRPLGQWTMAVWGLLFLEWLLGIVTAWNHAVTRFLTGWAAGTLLPYALFSAFYHHLVSPGADSPARTLSTSSS